MNYVVLLTIDGVAMYSTTYQYDTFSFILPGSVMEVCEMSSPFDFNLQNNYELSTCSYEITIESPQNDLVGKYLFIHS